MPNWVRVTVIAKDANVLKEKLLNDKGNVDFNKLIPMPEELEISSGSNSYTALSATGFRSEYTDNQIELQKPADEIMVGYYNDTITQRQFVDKCIANEELCSIVRQIKGWTKEYASAKPLNDWTKEVAESPYETFFRGYFNVHRFGHNDWYDWSIENWGTKWNAKETFVVDDHTVDFETAWSMPAPIFVELAKYTDIRVIYADEDLGSNCGVVDYKYNKETGELDIDEIITDSRALAYIVWGYDNIEVYDDDNWDEITDENDERVIAATKEYTKMFERFEQLRDVSTL